VGDEARKLFNDAQTMLSQIIQNRSLKATGIIGFYPANSVGEDVEIYMDESRTTKKATLFGLRQQLDNETNDVYLAYGDFIAPKESQVADYIGMFAVSTGFGVEKLKAKYSSENDDYSIIMVEALADRLAEAFAEKIHEEVRKEYWGYQKSENLSLEDKLKVKYQGIRPAPGYPGQPDHTEKGTIWDVMKVEEQVGIQLTESLAMLPASSVSGLYFANKEAKYFAVGKITKDQILSYADRKKWDLPTTEKWLGPIIAE